VRREGSAGYEIADTGEHRPFMTHVYRFDVGRPPAEPPLSVPFSVTGTKGLIVRTLVNDFGAALGCGACLETLRRVRYMERLLDEVLAAQKDTERTWPWYRMRQLKVLEDYYENGLWKLDYESDEKGLLPKSMKRGVLAQDTLYNLFDEVWQLRKENPCKGRK
jgi:tRNA U55 pseudouridine synthase TruB